MKKVCVVSNVIGNRDVIYDGKNGFVCSSVGEFVKAIKSTNRNRNTNGTGVSGHVEYIQHESAGKTIWRKI